VAALAAVPSIEVRGIAAGLHAVVDLPVDGPAEADVVESLAAAGVVVHGLSGYWHRPRSRRPGIVVGFGTPAEHQFPAALAALTEALRLAVAGSLP
jgi:GntR family transcriptional regulator/MocR family aminotransferase